MNLIFLKTQMKWDKLNSKYILFYQHEKTLLGKPLNQLHSNYFIREIENNSLD